MKNTRGVKNDEGKLRYDLLPCEALSDIVSVLTMGANKYGPNNWDKVDDYKDRYFAAAQRHLWAWKSGELIDDESGKSHLAHAICSLMFILNKESTVSK